MELLRSLIFVPGNRANMLERALGFNADIIMVDLEDSVPPAEKVAARDLARQWVPTLRQAGKRVMVRANSLDTGLTRDELTAVISPDLYGVSVGKTESVWDLREIDRIIAPLEAAAGLQPGQIKLIPWIESARAVVNVNELAAALPRSVAIAFGAEDYTNDMGIQRTDDGAEVYHPPRHHCHCCPGRRCRRTGQPLRGLSQPRGTAAGCRGGPTTGLYRKVCYPPGTD